MKPSMLIISGWAHGIEAIRPLGDAFSDTHTVRLITGTEVLHAASCPDAEVILSGSMGGLLAMEHLPPGCRKLALISSTARFCATDDYPHGAADRVVRRMIRQLKRSPEAVLETFYANVHAPHDPIPTDPECSLDDLVLGLEYLLETDLRSHVTDLTIPVLLIHGREDRIIPASAAEWLAGQLPDARLELIPNEGHAPAAHCFDRTIGCIRTFLGVL